MPLKVAVYLMNGHRRSTLCCQAMKDGIRASGDVPEMINDTDHRGADHDACVFYGFTNNLQRVMMDYKAAGKPAVYLDLGYWSREKNNGYHKIVVNGRHPTAYFKNRKHDAKRAKALGIVPRPWRLGGDHILLAGMGAKASIIAEHMPFESFERAAIREIRKHTQRPIVYRPKPSCKVSGAIIDTIFSPGSDPLVNVLANCHAVVTHHSNVAVEALVAGIPAFCVEGVAVPMALQDYARIETPLYPDDRDQWINDIAYCQWNWEEMTAGRPWRHLKDEGLIP